MNHDPELESLRADWQTLGDGTQLSSSLLARVERDSGKMKWAAAKEVLAAIFSTTTISLITIRKNGTPELIVLTALICLFNGAWLTHFFTTRASIFSASGRSLDAFVSLTRERGQVELRWVTFARRWQYAIGIAILPVLVWFFFANREAYLASPWRMVVGFGGAGLIFAGVLIYLNIKERKLKAEADAFERAVASASLE